MSRGLIPASFAVIVLTLLGVTLLYAEQNGGEFDSQPPDLPPIIPSPNVGSIQNFADAIETAEGFGIAGAIPTLAKNPGDLVIPGWTGPTLGQGISVFSTETEGRARLIHQLQIIIDGTSRVYSLDDTIQSMAQKWTRTNQTAWANIVAGVLQVPASTTLRDILGGQ
jgi:hypothetical protein